MMKKAMEIYFVHFASFASIVRPLFLPKNVSAPPAIAPERPEERLSCNRTTTIIKIEEMINKTPKIIWSADMEKILRSLLIYRISLAHDIEKSKFFLPSGLKTTKKKDFLPAAHGAISIQIPAAIPPASISACNKNAVQKERTLLHRTISSLFTFCLIEKHQSETLRNLCCFSPSETLPAAIAFLLIILP